MAQSAVAERRKLISKSTELSDHVAELATVTNSILTNIKGQSDVNEALTRKLLTLETRLSQLEAKVRSASAAPAASAVPANSLPKILERAIQRLMQGQNTDKAIYLGDHLALAQVLDHFKMYVDTRDIGISPHLMFGGYWEIWITKIFCDLLRPGMTVVDVGANFGYYTLLAAAGVHPNGRVHAIEADPHNFEILSRNVEVNGYQDLVKIYQCAALNERREVTLHQYRNHFGSNSIFSNRDDPRITNSVKVQGIPLDVLIDTPVDFMKIDAEGCEPLIFDGMKEIIRRSPNIRIVMEFAPLMIRATMDPQEFLQRIRRTGLVCQAVSHQSKLETWPDERLLAPEIHTIFLSRP